MVSSYCKMCRERTIIGSVSYRNRYWVYRIEVSNRISYCCIGRYTRINADRINCWQDRITHDDQRAFKRPVTRPPRACMRACCFMVHDTGEGWRGGKQKETVTWYTSLPVTQGPRITGLGHYHAALPPPAGSDNNSQLSITLTFLQVNQS